MPYFTSTITIIFEAGPERTTHTVVLSNVLLCTSFFCFCLHLLNTSTHPSEQHSTCSWDFGRARVQGKWAFADPKFINILRNDIGFDGSVMTDAWSERSLDGEALCDIEILWNPWRTVDVATLKGEVMGWWELSLIGSVDLYDYILILYKIIRRFPKVEGTNAWFPQPLPFKHRWYFFWIRFKRYHLFAVSSYDARSCQITQDWFASWEAITGGMILGEIGKTSPFHLQKGFIPSNSTSVVAIVSAFFGSFTLQVGGACSGWQCYASICRSELSRCPCFHAPKQAWHRYCEASQFLFELAMSCGDKDAKIGWQKDSPKVDGAMT